MDEVRDHNWLWCHFEETGMADDYHGRDYINIRWRGETMHLPANMVGYVMWSLKVLLDNVDRQHLDDTVAAAHEILEETTMRLYPPQEAPGGAGWQVQRTGWYDYEWTWQGPEGCCGGDAG